MISVLINGLNSYKKYKDEYYTKLLDSIKMEKPRRK